MASKIILRRVNRVYSIHYWRYSALKLKKKKLLSLLTKLGGLGIPTFPEVCGSEYDNSRLLTDNLRTEITSQERRYKNNSKLKIIKNKITQFRNRKSSEKLCTIRK